MMIADLFYSTEPWIPVQGGPLHQGYRLALEGHEAAGWTLIESFLAAVYPSRDEALTEFFVRDAYRRHRRPIPKKRADHDLRMVMEGVHDRMVKCHIPLFQSIARNGYRADSPAITVKKINENWTVMDGKNRSSILAAMGWSHLPKTRTV